MNPVPILTACNIQKCFYDPIKTDIIKDVSLSLYPKKSAGIVGKSGEGKTTLLHILGSLDAPTSGKVEICGTEVTNKTSDTLRNQHIGFVFQAFHLLADFTVLENVLMPAKIARKHGVSMQASIKRAKELLEVVGLQHRVDYPANKLSGGEKQRVAIARAFINDPEIILADEPTGNLDHVTAAEVQKLLLDAVSQFNKSLIVVTHNLQLAKLFDDCYVLENGYLHAAQR